ncbi:Sister chromatid cohesion protein DCC1, partial [Stegodyphus mimosarum]
MAGNEDLLYAKEKIELAGLDSAEVFPVYQSLTLCNDQDDIVLLELNPELKEQVTGKKVLTIRGDLEDTAVICTENQTFEIKEVETSNSLLLMPELILPEKCQDKEEKVVEQNISGVFHNYYEVRPFKPNFRKLRIMLERNAYRGKEYEEENLYDKVTVESLLDIVQASEGELKAALVEMPTCIIDGSIRILDFDYKFSVFSSIMDIIESKSLPVNKIPKESVLDALDDSEPKEIYDQCFSWFTQETGDMDESGKKLYALDETSVCKLYAEVLLRSVGKFHLDDFLKSWQRSVPEGMKCDLRQLRGIALADRISTPEVIFYFPSYDLPENIKERFEKLFKIKEKWAYEEIYPYLEDLASAKNDVKSLLIKYTRESTKDGKKFYSSKW